ncbi:MAG TPA: L,D-transpeptidase family protein [Polyangium sp.]|jgi:murein L,D-transpeptidase YafK|nr:L,D-transpeptidase family protein [Polyangium sp.]
MKHLFTLLALPLALVLMATPSTGAPQAKKAKLPTTKISQIQSKEAKRRPNADHKSKPASTRIRASKTAEIHTDKPDANKVTLVYIDKSDHKLELRAGSRVIKTYKVAIGLGGMGPKQFEGDMTTPVGHYQVTTRFRPLFHQFIGVSYPNEEDRKRYATLKRQGKVPDGRGVGFGIGIHGVGSRKLSGIHKQEDWTHGCIAMDDDEIDEFGSLVPEGTAIEIVD